LAVIGKKLAFIFAPLGWGDWRAAVAAITGLVAKENVVGSFGIFYGFSEVSETGKEVWGALSASFTTMAAYSFLVFNLLCAPCFAAMGAIKREMNNIRWFWFAVGYQTLFAYGVSLSIYQIGTFIMTGQFGIGTVVGFLIVVLIVFLMVRPYKPSDSFKFNIANMQVKKVK
ncbi:MAG TPA: ferrous iron transporter B, partial [Candidatus Dorea intestinavium]|nr:ferrous iron transporter B [Candidatus Dorea intestinavium]